MTLPLILLSNDDGFQAPGLVALRAELERFAEVVVCAPERNQSASSHALTLEEVLRLRQHSATTFALSGTPADCVYVALNTGTRVVPRQPDLVVSGMNRGPNLGIDVLYSGTVAAAREAALRGICAIAVSSDVDAEVPRAVEIASGLVERALTRLVARPPAQPLLINVNIPRGSNGSLEVTRLGRRVYRDRVLSRVDPRGKEYLWLGTAALDPAHNNPPGTDGHAHQAGHVSVTPLSLDHTAREQQPLVRELVGQCN